MWIVKVSPKNPDAGAPVHFGPFEHKRIAQLWAAEPENEGKQIELIPVYHAFWNTKD